jgi:ferredoxin-NADP reductase
MQVVFDHAETEASGIITFYFKPERRVRFEPGQFADLRVPHDDVDDRGDSREFSLSNSPNESLIAITTNFAQRNGSSFKRALRNLKPGDGAFLAEPMGDFVLPKDTLIPLVFVAGGIGCVPYASMIKWLVERGEQRTTQLIYSASTPHDFAFSELWHSYSLDFIPIVTQPPTTWHGQTSQLTAQKILKLVKSPSVRGQASRDSRDQLIYLAGPQPMIEPLFNDLLKAGIPRSQLLLDYFTGY